MTSTSTSRRTSPATFFTSLRTIPARRCSSRTRHPASAAAALIRCKSGEVPVETLKVGDKVRTLSGKLKPITWIGHGRRLITAATQNARPLVVCRGALGKDVPKRDLRLTRGHSLYLDGMLVPVEYLVNGSSIYWDERMREVEFYHIELKQHDVLVADGAPAESYREDGNRGLFDNPDPPRFTTAETPWFAPVVTGGPELDTLWRRLLERSGFSPPALIDDPDLHCCSTASGLTPSHTSRPSTRSKASTASASRKCRRAICASPRGILSRL